MYVCNTYTCRCTLCKSYFDFLFDSYIQSMFSQDVAEVTNADVTAGRKKKKHLHAACGGASSWVNNPPRNGDGAPVMTYIKKKYVTKRKPRTI